MWFFEDPRKVHRGAPCALGYVAWSAVDAGRAPARTRLYPRSALGSIPRLGVAPVHGAWYSFTSVTVSSVAMSFISMLEGAKRGGVEDKSKMRSVFGSSQVTGETPASRNESAIAARG